MEAFRYTDDKQDLSASTPMSLYHESYSHQPEVNHKALGNPGNEFRMTKGLFHDKAPGTVREIFKGDGKNKTATSYRSAFIDFNSIKIKSSAK